MMYLFLDLSCLFIYIGKTESSKSRCFVNNSRTPATCRNNITYNHFMQILDTVERLN